MYQLVDFTISVVFFGAFKHGRQLLQGPKLIIGSIRDQPSCWQSPVVDIGLEIDLLIDLFNCYLINYNLIAKTNKRQPIKNIPQGV